MWKMFRLIGRWQSSWHRLLRFIHISISIFGGCEPHTTSAETPLLKSAQSEKYKHFQDTDGNTDGSLKK